MTFDQDNILPFNQENGSHISVSSDLETPPWFTNIIVSESIIKASDILIEDTYTAKSALDQGFIKDTPIPQDNFFGDLDEYMIPEEDLLLQLFDWTRFNDPKNIFK